MAEHTVENQVPYPSRVSDYQGTDRKRDQSTWEKQAPITADKANYGQKYIPELSTTFMPTTLGPRVLRSFPNLRRLDFQLPAMPANPKPGGRRRSWRHQTSHHPAATGSVSKARRWTRTTGHPGEIEGLRRRLHQLAWIIYIVCVTTFFYMYIFFPHVSSSSYTAGLVI